VAAFGALASQVVASDHREVGHRGAAARALRVFSPRDAGKIDFDERRAEEQRTLPGLAGGFKPQPTLAFGGGVWLGGQHLRRRRHRDGQQCATALGSSVDWLA
jgi:hypothetical protein